MRIKAYKGYASFNGPHLIGASLRRADVTKAAADQLGSPWSKLRGTIKVERVIILRGAVGK